MAFILIRSTSPEATSTASPAEEVRSKFRSFAVAMWDFRRASRFRCHSSWPTCSATITSNKSSNRGRTAWQAERQPPRKQSATLRGSWHSRRKAGAGQEQWAHTGAKRHN